MPAPSLPLLLPAVDPTPVEAATEAAGRALEQALLPLFLYCEKAQGRADLSDYQLRHVLLIRGALDQLAEYATQLEQLLRVHRANVAGLNTQLHRALYAQPQPLEKAMQLDWEGIALGLLDRLRRPADQATPLSPLVARIRQSESFQRAQARLATAPHPFTSWPPHADAA